MKTQQSTLILLLLAMALTGLGQVKTNLGGGYFGKVTSQSGIFIEIEKERFQSSDLSVPIRLDVGHFITKDFNESFIDIHTGFRRYLANRLFIEQSIGLGITSRIYTIESIWYIDKYANPTRYNKGLNASILSSVTLGIGYNLPSESKSQNSIWVRPKIYWNLGFRSLHLPYSAIQFGFTHNLKSK